jgi:hypothetical protein
MGSSTHSAEMVPKFHNLSDGPHVLPDRRLHRWRDAHGLVSWANASPRRHKGEFSVFGEAHLREAVERVTASGTVTRTSTKGNEASGKPQATAA